MRIDKVIWGVPAIVLWTAIVACTARTEAAEPGRRQDVMPLELAQPADGKLAAARESIYLASQKQARYLLGTVRPWKEDASLLLVTDSRSSENWIRPNSGTVEGLAFLYRFGPYDETIVGVPREQLPKTVLPMMRYLVTTHVTGTRPTSDGRPWGDAWQSAHWAQMLGRAAWWIWEDLPDDLRTGVRRVVAHEAGRFVQAQPPHRIELDTKPEEKRLVT